MDFELPQNEPDPPETLAAPPAALRLALRRYFAARGFIDADIDDLVQDVFLRIVRRGALADIDNLEAYAFATAASVLADRFRRRATVQDPRVVYLARAQAVDDAAPDRILAGRQALRTVTRALLELPERARRVFILRRLEGLSFKEISVRLGVSLSTVEKDMQSAIRHVVSRSGDAS